jgi:hypothetical protein
MQTLPKGHWPSMVISHSICSVSAEVTFTAGVICA